MTRNRLVKFKPPVILLLLLLGATALHFWTPLKTIMDWQNPVLGAVMFGAGVWLMWQAQRLFRRAGTTIIPAEKPTVFVVKGPYKFTRNPMYVAGACLTLGLAFMIGTLPFFLVWLGMFSILNYIHIPFEEGNLEQTFGDDYRDYKKRVRRWL